MGRRMQKMNNFHSGSRPQRMWRTMTSLKEWIPGVDELPDPHSCPPALLTLQWSLSGQLAPQPSAPAPAFLQSTGQQVERRWISTLPSNSLQRLLSISHANISHRGLHTCSFSTGSKRCTSHPRVCWWNRETVRRRGALMVIMIIMMIVMTA